MTQASVVDVKPSTPPQSTGKRHSHGTILGAVLVSLSLCFLLGCHSNFVEATVTNATGQSIRLLEIDYPSASFGTQDLAAGADFHYRFKILGDGPAKLIWTDAQEKEHTVPGPALHEGQEGAMRIRIDPATADWHLDLHSK